MSDNPMRLRAQRYAPDPEAQARRQRRNRWQKAALSEEEQGAIKNLWRVSDGDSRSIACSYSGLADDIWV